MRILLVIGSQVNGFPPVRNLLEVLLRNNYIVTLMARDNTGLIIEKNENFRFIKIPEYEGSNALIGYLKKRKFMRDVVKREMEYHDILWTATDATVRDLGDLVLNYRHVMQLMELIKDIPRFPGQNTIGLNIKKYAQHAFKVVVPEYNRAHIQKIWWSLPQLPSILPNKMTIPTIDKNIITPDVKKIIKRAEEEERKIILYQGVFYEDRDLEPFVKAAMALKDKFVLYLMGAKTDYKTRLCSMDPDIIDVPFIKPPLHLLVTEKAFIGLLPYKASTYLHYDIINALYCAPNKLYEYAAFGIPMLGTDVPGLHEPFTKFGIGYTCQPYTFENIVTRIEQISNNYNRICENCKKFYSFTDLDEIVTNILEN